MRRFLAIAVLAVMATLTQLTAARADFFRLDGRFQCLESGAAICGDARPLPQPQAAPPAPKPQPVAAKPIEAPAVSAVTRVAAVASVPAAAPAPTPRIDPLQVVAARVKARRPSSHDLAWLAQAADVGDARAIELLAWCKLNAIGMARNPVEAYLLYGAAGNAALPHARENQRLIFERDLNSHQRQQVLDLANEGVTLARLMPSAR